MLSGVLKNGRKCALITILVGIPQMDLFWNWLEHKGLRDDQGCAISNIIFCNSNKVFRSHSNSSYSCQSIM